MLAPKLLLFTTILTALSSCGNLARNYRYPSGNGKPEKNKGSSAARFGLAAARGTTLSLVRHPIMDIANRDFADELVKAGGKAYAYPGMTHLKVMICDDWACVGSANLDTLSMRINRELNLAFRAPGPLNGLIDQVFRPDFAKSKLHTSSDASSAVAPLAEAVADQL